MALGANQSILENGDFFKFQCFYRKQFGNFSIVSRMWLVSSNWFIILINIFLQFFLYSKFVMWMDHNVKIPPAHIDIVHIISKPKRIIITNIFHEKKQPMFFCSLHLSFCAVRVCDLNYNERKEEEKASDSATIIKWLLLILLATFCELVPFDLLIRLKHRLWLERLKIKGSKSHDVF